MVLGFDSSVLSAFARAKRLDVLEHLTSGHRRVVTRAVLGELDRGRTVYPALTDVESRPWLELTSVDSLEELIAFNQYVRVLGESSRNIGEASILAWAEITSNTAVIDDNDAVSAARARHVSVRRSLGLMADGLHRRILTSEQARSVIDDLILIGGARFPCDGAGFEAWAERNGLLAPDSA
jgi:predicted nucleic acid-binding protein